MTPVRTAATMHPGESHGRSFTRSLSLAFAGSGLILLLAGAFALYLMSQLGTAVERAIDDILPKTLVAMRLAENSALLAASAPKLTNARTPQETEQLGADLDALKKAIDTHLATLTESSGSDRLAQIRDNVAVLADTLSRLKRATDRRLALDERRSAAMARIHAVHSEFTDMVSPVVWGVSSLTRRCSS